MRAAYQGEALDWNRLDFAARKFRMETAVVEELLGHEGAARVTECAVVLPIGGEHVMIVCHAIPAPMTVSQAREMVGQPFLHDHDHLAATSDSGGPVHLIACYGNVTDAQARRQLGFPDATIVSPPFGIWVADPVQKIQMLFLAGCVDSTTTAGQVSRAFEWFARAGEDTLLASRARSRARIVKAITAELASAGRLDAAAEPAPKRSSRTRSLRSTAIGRRPR